MTTPCYASLKNSIRNPTDRTIFKELCSYLPPDIRGKNKTTNQTTDSKTSSVIPGLIIALTLAGGAFLIATSGGGLSLFVGLALVAVALITIAVQRMFDQKEESWTQKLLNAILKSEDLEHQCANEKQYLISKVISLLRGEPFIDFAQRATTFIFQKNGEKTKQEAAILISLAWHPEFETLAWEMLSPILERVPQSETDSFIFYIVEHNLRFEEYVKAAIKDPEELPQTLAAVADCVQYSNLDHPTLRQLMAVVGQEKADEIVKQMTDSIPKFKDFANSTHSALVEKKEEVSQIVLKALGSSNHTKFLVPQLMKYIDPDEKE